MTLVNNKCLHGEDEDLRDLEVCVSCYKNALSPWALQNSMTMKKRGTCLISLMGNSEHVLMKVNIVLPIISTYLTDHFLSI